MKGSIALTTVLLIGVMITAGSIVLVLTTVDLSRSTKQVESGQRVKEESRTCLEEAMYKLTRVPTYLGEVSYTNTDFYCTATVAEVPGQPNQRAIAVNGVFGEYISGQTYTVDLSTEPYQLLP